MVSFLIEPKLELLHLFVMLDGEGLYCCPEGKVRMKPRMAIIVGPEETHWFENDSEANLKFVEFWAPRPVNTVWVVENDT